jgi:type I restriction enzyme M protein
MVPKTGKRKGIRRIQDILETIPSGKIRCYLTGQYRNDTPEEHVRQRMARSLVEEYGYLKTDMEIEFKIILGRAKKRADIVVFDKGSKHLQENSALIVEAKRDSIKPNDRENGVEQLHSYMAACPNAKFGLWVGSEIIAFEKVDNGKKLEFETCMDVPFSDGQLRIATSFSALVPATDSLKNVFWRCHNYISANQGGSKEFAFHEFLKITFCKVFDEKTSKTPQFYIAPEERKSKQGQTRVFQRIGALFAKVCAEYGYIFGKDEEIKLSEPVVAYIVAELQKYSLIDTDYDYKGEAYEEIVGSNSRGDRGEFFTPRNLCSLAVNIVKKIIGETNFQDVKLLDPACGTGGFLKSYVHSLYSQLLIDYQEKWQDANKAREAARGRVKEICDRNVFGIDFNPVLVRAAQMNLVMHGDGSCNVYHDNSLKSCGEWKDHTRSNISDGVFDVILTNPPFGEELSVDDPHILSQYELTIFNRRGERKQIAPQELFLERCWRLLKPEGYFAVIIPDNILSNPSYLDTRQWIIIKFRIIASISLPVEMFQPSTGTQTSLVVLQKRRRPFSSIEDMAKIAQAEDIFLSVPQKIGHDLRGNLIPMRDESGNVIIRKLEKKVIVHDPVSGWREDLVEDSQPVPYDDLPRVFEDFCKWYHSNRSL